MTPGTPPPERIDAVITFSFDTWRDAEIRGGFRPPERLARHLMRSPDVRSTLVVNPFRSIAGIARHSLGRGAHSGFPTTDHQRLLQPLRARRTERRSIAAARRDYERYDRAIERASRRMGMTHPIVITCNPLVAGFAPMEWARGVVYYARDDWAVHPSYEQQRGLIEAAYASVRSRPVPVAAVSATLHARITDPGSGIVVPNGLDAGEWAVPSTTPEWMAGLPRPIAIYSGMLDGRLDPDQLQAAVRALEGGTLVLLGPMTDDVHVSKKLATIEGALVHPRVLRDELVAAVHAADLGLVLHAPTDLTTAMSPLKLYEYLAAGLPVVATRLPGMEGVDPSVELVESVDDVHEAVRRALTRGRATDQARRRFIDANRWESRFNLIIDLASNGLPAHGSDSTTE